MLEIGNLLFRFGKLLFLWNPCLIRDISIFYARGWVLRNCIFHKNEKECDNQFLLILRLVMLQSDFKNFSHRCKYVNFFQNWFWTKKTKFFQISYLFNLSATNRSISSWRWWIRCLFISKPNLWGYTCVFRQNLNWMPSQNWMHERGALT